MSVYKPVGTEPKDYSLDERIKFWGRQLIYLRCAFYDLHPYSADPMGWEIYCLDRLVDRLEKKRDKRNSSKFYRFISFFS